MKLTSYLFCFLATATAASALAEPVKVPAHLPGVPMDDAPVYDPQGEDVAYIMNVTETNFFGPAQCDGYKMTIREDEDGKVIWFRDLVPGFNGDGIDIPYAWVKGVVDGDEIVIKAGQMIYNQPENDQVLYIEAVTVDENGIVSNFLDELRFSVSEGRFTQTDPNIYLAVYEDGETMEDAGFFIFMNNYEMEPVGDITTFSPPAGVESEKWVMKSNSGTRFVNVARDGNDVYIAGLSAMAPGDYVPGAIEGNTLTIKSGYILTSAPRYYVCLMGGEEGEPDEWGMPSITMSLKMTFSVNDGGTEFTLTPDNGCIIETNYFKTGYFSATSGVTLTKYDGDKPAVPASPEVFDYDSLNNILIIYVPTFDTEGNFINAEYLSYAIYFDGEPYTFSPEDYNAINESMTYIPYNFTENWDIYFNGSLHKIYLHNTPEWDNVEISSKYTVDGVTNYSPNTPNSGVEGITDDSADGEIVSENFTDLLGRTVTSPRSGAVIIRTATYSSGKKVTSKIIVK